ncbi:MAG: type II secretion system F family protein [Deltaproteobacteria bacterium]|nr:type II secretion system F family protein [Deltaproteobacteria bacterium]
MPDYSYKAINQNGDSVSGVITAENVDMATTILSNQGYIPSKIAERSAVALLQFEKLKAMITPVTPEDLIIFTKQFRTMLVAGIQIVQILEILERQTQNPKLKEALKGIGIDIKGGESIAGAFEKYEHIFSSLYISMLTAGEASGTLPDVLKRLTYILEHEHKVKSDIKSALQYPKLVVIALGGAFFILLTFVIPKFESIFRGAGIALPLPTRICIAMNLFLKEYWYLLLAAIILSIAAYRLYVKTSNGRYVVDTLKLKVPIIGPLFIKAAMSRFASIFSILQASGVKILSSLQILSGTIGNQAIAFEFDRIKELVEEGRGISGPLKSAKYFPPMVIDMIAVGEETGQLDEMLNDVSNHYDDEVEYAVKRLSDNIGPILIVALAAVVGFFALAIFLPMWDLTKLVR